MYTLPSRQAVATEASTSTRRSSVRVPTHGRPNSLACHAHSSSIREVTLLDYGAGNVRSVRNAIKKLGYTVRDVRALYVFNFLRR